jgi:2-polyprenyl-3-methyl-5-hydroxy-6-metoxy-1,4-benzoquinol methylase
MSDNDTALARERANADRPFDAATSHRIASAFLPKFPLGNRYDYYYTRTKLRTDPLYPGVLAALRGTHAPVLDLGCGLGLLAHALRADGQSMAYFGVDNDAAKIVRAQRVSTALAFRDTRFERMDLAREMPEHRGSVAILDVLQYLDRDGQRTLLRHAAAMLSEDAVLVLRSAIADDSGRSRTSRVSDRLANVIGWMQFRPRSYPTLADLRATLQEAGLRVDAKPLYGDTPFNNWLIVARR